MHDDVIIYSHGLTMNASGQRAWITVFRSGTVIFTISSLGAEIHVQHHLLLEDLDALSALLDIACLEGVREGVSDGG